MLKHIPRKNESNSVFVYRTMKQSIIEFYFIPGDKINEVSIANELNVSRTPVREALILLEREKLVNIVPKKGTYVTEIDINEVNNFMFMRKVIEAEINAIACEIRSKTDLKTMKEQLQAQKIMQNFIDDRTSLYLLDKSYHKFIYTLCGHVKVWKELQKIANDYNRINILAGINQDYNEKIYIKNNQIYELVANKKSANMKEYVASYLMKIDKQTFGLMQQYPAYFK